MEFCIPHLKWNMKLLKYQLHAKNDYMPVSYREEYKYFSL